MKRKPGTPADAAALRRRAEARLKARQQPSRSKVDAPRLLQELQIHQVELEMQNEELRRTQSELEAALERHTELYDFAPTGYLTLHPDGSIRQSNLAAASLLGIDRARLLGRRLALFIAAADRAAVAKLLARAWASQTREVGEVTLASEGRPPLAVQICACASAEGQECRVVMTDISERKRAEALLGASELFARGILDSLTAHIAVLDATGLIIRVNDAWRRFARENGAAHADAYLGANYLEVCEASLRRKKEDTVEAALRGLRAVMSGEQDEFSLEYPCHSPDEHRWFSVRVARFAGEGAGRVVVAHENITQRRLAQEALRLSELKYRKLHETMRDAFVSVDMAGRIQEYNRAYQEMLGYDGEELKRLTYVDLTPEKWHAFEARIVAEQILPRGFSDVYEKEYRRRDGTIIPVELRTFLIRDE